MDEQNFGQELKPEEKNEAEKLSKTKSVWGLIIGLLVLLLLSAGIYWFLQKEEPTNTSQDKILLTQENGEEKEEVIEWTKYVSDDNVFSFDYPGNWERLDDEGLVFGVIKHDDKNNVLAMLKVEKLEATNKIELQEVLDQKNKTCMETKDDCPEAIVIDDLERFKISGETARIDTENKYLSGTTIYIYAEDYYLAIYEEYNDEAFLPIFEKIIDSIYVDAESRYKHYYCNREPGVVSIENELSAYCHRVEEGETLWSIAERYYGDPHLWEQLKLYDQKREWDLSRVSPDDPNAVSPGTELVLWNALQFSFDERTAGGISDGWGLDTDTSDLFTTGNRKVYKNNSIYDQDFSWVYTFMVDERTNNKVYVVSPVKEDGESGRGGWIFQFVFNRQRNPYIGPGATFELLTFNHDEDKYAVRTNVRQGVSDPGFKVLSNIGNGPEFDYLDSLIWYDNDTLIYRAQLHDDWRLVINHEDYKQYDYLENLRVEDGAIKFDFRKDNGSWDQEEIVLTDDEYNAEVVSLYDQIPVGDEFLIYLKDTRADLSEDEIIKIEKKYHSKKGTLVDEFGNLVEDTVELYLDPVPDMGMSENIERLTFTATAGRFELLVDEIGIYTLSLEDGWHSEELEKMNPIDFRKKDVEYKMLVSNEEYDKKAKARYNQTAEEGDTLWTMSEKYYEHGYYWPLIAKNNDLDYEDGMPKINVGDEFYMPPLIHFSSIEELDGLRIKYHQENVEPKITINNENVSYAIDYPECWHLGDVSNKPYNENDIYYNSYIHKQWIRGPEYPNLPGKGRRPFVFVVVYDNREGLDVEEFVLSKHIVEQYSIDEGRFSTEEQENGGLLILGSSGDLKHVLFFKDDLVYDVAREQHYSMDDVSKQESLDIVDSFRLID